MEDDICVTAVFPVAIKDLAGVYGRIRRTRGDGNCFFRAFAFACMEKLLKKELVMKRWGVLSVVSVCMSVSHLSQQFC